jgi:hypothetical protein
MTLIVDVDLDFTKDCEHKCSHLKIVEKIVRYQKINSMNPCLECGDKISREEKNSVVMAVKCLQQ